MTNKFEMTFELNESPPVWGDSVLKQMKPDDFPSSFIQAPNPTGVGASPDRITSGFDDWIKEKTPQFPGQKKLEEIILDVARTKFFKSNLHAIQRYIELMPGSSIEEARIFCNGIVVKED